MRKLNRKKIKLNFSNTVLLLLLTLVLFTVLIIAVYVRSNAVQPQTETFENLNQQTEDNNAAKPTDFSGASKLLQVLPYGTSDFTVNYLSLEKDVKPVITVTYLTDLGEAKFNEWIETIVFDPMTVEFNYLPIPVYEIFQ